jgi:hypothetical protein
MRREATNATQRRDERDAEPKRRSGDRGAGGMGGGDEVSDGAEGSRREGDTPCATRRVSTARAREKTRAPSDIPRGGRAERRSC